MGYKVIDGTAMTADIASALIDISDVTHVSLHITTATTGTQDHEGVIYFRQTNVNSISSPIPVAITTPTVTINTSAVANDFVELSDLTGRYLQVFYDRTGGGTDDTLTVRVWRKRNNVYTN